MALGVSLGSGSGITNLLYKFEGNSNDSSGNANNGTDTAMTYGLAYGKHGQGASFNGTSSKIVTGSNLGISGSSARTYAFWANPSNVTSLNVPFSHGANASLANDSIEIRRIGNGDIYWEFGSNDFYTGNVLSTSTWYRIVCVYDSGTLSTSTVHIYVNGVAQSLTYTGGASAANTTASVATFGTVIGGGSFFYSGNMDDFIAENVAWSATNVQKDYTYQKGRFGII